MSTLRKIIDSIDNSDENAAVIRESLTILMDLAESKAELLENAIIMDLKDGKTTDGLNIPILKIINKNIQYLGTTSQKASDILSEVSASINDMIVDHNAGGIVTGISKIAASALNTIMDIGAGEEQAIRFYSVVVDYPAIVRFDFAFWNRKMSAKSLKQYCETALACVVYKSAVDITRLKFNDFLAAYGPVLNEGFGNDQSKIKNMIRQAQEIYHT